MLRSIRSALLAAGSAAALLAGAAGAEAATTVTEAEALALAASGGTRFADSAASGGRALLVWSNATATGTFSSTAARRLVVRARGEQCGGALRMAVAVDGRIVLEAAVPSAAWSDLGVDLPLRNGSHTLAISFTNDASAAGCDRNLRVDKVTVGSTAGWPFAGRRFYVEPDSSARAQADAWRATRPDDAAQIEKIAAQPAALWLGGWNADVTAAVRARADAARAAGAVPVLVAYNIPSATAASTPRAAQAPRTRTAAGSARSPPASPGARPRSCSSPTRWRASAASPRPTGPAAWRSCATRSRSSPPSRASASTSTAATRAGCRPARSPRGWRRPGSRTRRASS
jgi:hypothetical protein